METHNEKAFNVIVNRYGDNIYWTALRITHNPSDAEDVLQEVFIKLIEKLDTFHEESKFSTLLYRIALHLRDEEEPTNFETAKVIGISVCAAKSRIHIRRLLL